MPGKNPSKKKRDDVTVKVEANIHFKAKMVAAHRGIDLAEYLSELLRRPVDVDFRAMSEELANDTDDSDTE